MSGGTGEERHSGRPGACVLAGAVMLGVPGLWALVAPPHPTLSQSGATALGLLVSVVLLVGAAAVAAVTASPRQPGLAPLAVLCAALALTFGPVEAWADGLTGVAALAFLLTARLHAAALSGPVDTAEWFAARRPMLVGAAVTTPAAVAAALMPAAWSLPVAALVGMATAGLCAAILGG